MDDEKDKLLCHVENFIWFVEPMGLLSQAWFFLHNLNSETPSLST